ncbi:MAG: type II toxin-antitoxin system prevent-host-death family antitoxin [Planctomycetota bacterium]|nr:MAG: type II toxin-antitoxin system prevent-host-death family antitoxin [Planctomycetota bacterium]
MAISDSSVGAYEAKTRFSELLGRVEAGEEVTITRHGTPVAKLIPVRRDKSAAEIQQMFDAWDLRSADLTLGGLDLKQLIEEGRR